MKRQSFLVYLMFLLSMPNITSADMIQGIDIDFVTIGNAGNPADSTGHGAVDYDYRIGKYEVTNTQWNTFVNLAGAPTGNPSYAYDNGALYTGNQEPTNNVSWYEAVQFCNYLTSGDKSLGAYQFSSAGDFLDINRITALTIYGTIYVLPTEDEWYKAAYYNSSAYSIYANGTNTPPAVRVDSNYGSGIPDVWNVGSGTIEQNDTFDMMGNVLEWNETLTHGGGDAFYRGGSTLSTATNLMSSYSYHNNIYTENSRIGFRVVEVVPVPSAVILGSLGIGFASWRLRRMKRNDKFVYMENPR